jgi:hypothetical protein
LVLLDDPDTLTASRGYSAFVNISIYRWTFKRSTLIFRDEINGDGQGTSNECQEALKRAQQPQQHQIANSVPRVGKDVLLDCLTLRDVRELAEYELPKIPDTTKYGGRDGKEVDVTPGSLPHNLYMASVFGMCLLLFVGVYFNAFVREAVSSSDFPASGTLFGAFSRSAVTLAVFALVLSVPAGASLGLALVSRRMLLISCSVLIVCTFFSVYWTLHRKSYFRAANPLRLLRRKPD